MANIKKQEINFLESLYHKIKYVRNLSDEAISLASLINDLDDRNCVSRDRTRAIVAEKRISDPTYGRSKTEKDRIISKQTKSNV